MPTLQQRYTYTRFTMMFLSVFFFLLMLGQATLYPLILNYNYTQFPTQWFIFIITCTIFILFMCIYMAIMAIRNTYDDFMF
jgi:hypothetical protein